jgi:acyl dehydratase
VTEPPLPLDLIGTVLARSDPFEVRADQTRAYAAATNDLRDEYESGALAPPVFAVVPAWDALQQAARAFVPEEFMIMIVHGEQDIHISDPLQPGMITTSEAGVHSVHSSRAGALVTIEVSTFREDRAHRPLLNRQYATMVVRGLETASAGPDLPDHRLPPGCRERASAPTQVKVDADQTFRYRDASGDLMPIHVDDAVARSVGLPGIIVHGLCTLAMSAGALLRQLDASPEDVRRVATRFSRPVLPGALLEVTPFEVEPAELGFEVTVEGKAVLSHGRLSLAGSA